MGGTLGPDLPVTLLRAAEKEGIFTPAFTGASQRLNPALRESSHMGSSLLLLDRLAGVYAGARAHTRHKAFMPQPSSIDTVSPSGQGEELRPRKVQHLLKVTLGRRPQIEQDD